MTPNKHTLLALLERAHQTGARSEVVERLRWFVDFAGHQTVSKTCNTFDIARTTFYRWYNRLDLNDLSTLENAPKSALLSKNKQKDHHCMLCGLRSMLQVWRGYFSKKTRVALAVVVAIINISILFLIAIPNTVSAASSWAPTLIVNTEAFQVIDDTDSSADLYLQFGGSLNKRLTYNRTLASFIFDDDLEVIGTISGATLHAQDNLSTSGSLSIETSIFGAGLADCDNTTTSKLLWDATTGVFSCGTDTDTTIADTNTNQLTTFNLTGDSGTPEEIGQGNTLDIAGGDEIETAVGATDTVTINITDDTVDFTELEDTLDLDASTTLNFGGSNFIFDLTSTGDFMVRDNGSAAFFVDDSGRIGIGTEDLVSNIELDVAANDTLVDLYLKRIDSTISNGTGLGFIRFAGTDGGSESSPLIGAGIQGQAAGTWATGDSPANLIFWTTPDSSSTLTERMRIRPDGKVGIGTATPNAKLHVTAPVYQTGAYIYSSGATVLALDNYSGTTGSGTNAHIMFGYRNVFDTELYRHGDTGSGGIVIKTQQTSTSDNAFRIITQNGSANNTVFKVRADGAVTAEGSFTGGGADLAEWFPTADPGMTPGDITCLDPRRPKHVKRCNSRQLKMIGIYSTNPGFIGNSQMGMDGPSALIGLVGQVPVKVIGKVDIGDSITLSKTDSVGKRAGTYDQTICIAMEEHRGREIGAITCLLSRNTGSSAPINEKSVANYLLKTFKESMRLDDF